MIHLLSGTAIAMRVQDRRESGWAPVGRLTRTFTTVLVANAGISSQTSALSRGVNSRTTVTSVPTTSPAITPARVVRNQYRARTEVGPSTDRPRNLRPPGFVSVPVRHPWTTVIIPALDEEASIGDVIASAHSQLVDEIIVGDNGSRDPPPRLPAPRARGSSTLPNVSGVVKAGWWILWTIWRCRRERKNADHEMRNVESIPRHRGDIT